MRPHCATMAILSEHRRFFFFALITGALICMDYAIIRPVSTALFLTAFGSSTLPYVWLTIIPLNLLCVGLYNYVLVRLGCFKTFFLCTSLVIVGHIAARWFLQGHPWMAFGYFAWKEVYIMLMLQQLWSVVHATLTMQRAKYLYGLLFAGGGAGGIVGSMVPGLFAVNLGSEQLLYAALPVLLLAIGTYALMLKSTAQGLNYALQNQERTDIAKAFMHGISLIRSSRFLPFILLIVAFMQLTIALVEFQFGHALEHVIADKDLRTQMLGRIFGMVQSAGLGIQLLGSFLLVHFLGLKRSHLLIPCLIGIHQLAFLLFPAFGLGAFLFGTVKCMEYSAFGVLKELLYVPLSQDEKFRAKAFIDVFVHRGAKALGSLLILGCQAFFALHAQTFIALLSALLFGVWCLAVHKMFRREESYLHLPD